MVNLTLSGRRSLSMSFQVGERMFGPVGSERQFRMTVEVDVYAKTDQGYVFVTRGISILNPLDTHDDRIAAKKALASAMVIFSRADRIDAQEQLDTWFPQ